MPTAKQLYAELQSCDYSHQVFEVILLGLVNIAVNVLRSMQHSALCRQVISYDLHKLCNDCS